MTEFDYERLRYIQLRGDGSKLPAKSWGGYNQDFDEAEHVHTHDEVEMLPAKDWGVCDIEDPEHGSMALLVFDIDIHKAPDAFDADRVGVPSDTLVVKSQNGGFHVYFALNGYGRGDLNESDFEMLATLPFDIDIRGSVVSHHVKAPSDIPGIGGNYEVVNDDTIKAYLEPQAAAERITLDDEPLLEYQPDQIGGSYDWDRPDDAPEEMPRCYFRGLELRRRAPDDHPNTHKVNVLTALCGLTAGYDQETVVDHFVGRWAPHDGTDRSDRQKTEYQVGHLAKQLDRGRYSPPAESTLRQYGILDAGEHCENCPIDYHGPRKQHRTAAAEARAVAEPDGGAIPDDGGEGAISNDRHGPAAHYDSLFDYVSDYILRELDPPEDADIDPITQEVAQDRFATGLCEFHNFVYPREDTRGWREKLYVYSDEDGIYEPYGEEFIRQEVERLAGAWATNARVQEVVDKVKRRSRVTVRRLEAAPERLVVRNGVLDLTTGELHDKSPDEYHRTMIDVEYDPTAECPAIDEFLHDIVNDGDVPTLYRLIAHTLYKDYPSSKAAMLLGDGRNGKTVFLKLIEKFIGEWNVSNQALQKLNENQWAANNLVGKLANVHPDMSDETAETMQMFKKLTGGDTVSADVKFERPIRFENYATLMFACNRMPVLNDDSRGNWRRWLLIEFPNTFEPDDEETVEKSVLLDRLTADRELSGLLNRCVEEIRAWDEGGDWFPNAPDWEETRARIRQAAEPVVDFAASCLRDAEDGWESKKEVRRAYQAYATENGLPTMGREKFGKKLLYETDLVIETEQKRVNGHRVRAYSGIELTDRGRQLLQQRGSDGDEGDGQQSGFGGPQGRARRVVKLCRERVDVDGPVPHERLVGLAIGAGMDADKAEQAIQKARNQGDLGGSDEYLPT